MAIRFTHIRLSNGNQHEHITHLRGLDDQGSKTYGDSRASWVSWIEGGGSAFVQNHLGGRTAVVVVTPTSGPKFLRTVANGVYTDNLLSLPRY